MTQARARFGANSHVTPDCTALFRKNFVYQVDTKSISLGAKICAWAGTSRVTQSRRRERAERRVELVARGRDDRRSNGRLSTLCDVREDGCRRSELLPASLLNHRSDETRARGAESEGSRLIAAPGREGDRSWPHVAVVGGRGNEGDLDGSLVYSDGHRLLLGCWNAMLPFPLCFRV